MSNSDEAVARQTRAASRARAVFPTISAGLTSSVIGEHQIVGIHAVPLPIRQSRQSPNRVLGLDAGASASRGRAGLWTDEEINVLRRLVGSNTNPKGIVSWEKVDAEWKNLSLKERSKASLSSKWRDIKIRSVTKVICEDQNGSRDRTESNSEELVQGEIKESTTEERITNSSDVLDVNLTVANNQCKPVDCAEDVIKAVFSKKT
ncbi:unnamed protein product [Rotaria magnacalcarata]|uniref:Myb-like domain-containing protein n=1 Tax=Rotaria magnacalcarata TaxID=392030 RepID=A0A815EPV5_9BILA|nr:unnamed protein product [Rotaria magnacalcarata]CAF2183481.1 unnamed protein product [Rotaria magnacalcarata]CAF3797423.1 unnamed protein product [Rotaria magnacalcarata]CAF3860338.1 unnamed protein product [Rotaria magnacalcarata]CAF3943530.1 unnamed protein product [Rotaria magnacalcarata]